MGQTDKQFGGFLRMLISRLKQAAEAVKAQDTARAEELLREILADLQSTLED